MRLNLGIPPPPPGALLAAASGTSSQLNNLLFRRRPAPRSSTAAGDEGWAWATTSPRRPRRAPRRCSGAATAARSFACRFHVRLYAPVIDDPVYGYQGQLVEAERRDADGHLQVDAAPDRLNRNLPVFGRGDTAPRQQKVR